MEVHQSTLTISRDTLHYLNQILLGDKFRSKKERVVQLLHANSCIPPRVLVKLTRQFWLNSKIFCSSMQTSMSARSIFCVQSTKENRCLCDNVSETFLKRFYYIYPKRWQTSQFPQIL